VIGEINPNSSQLHKYILTTTDYFTRWMEAIPLKAINENQVISFLDSFIITRFGIPESLVFDNAKYFSSLKLTEYALDKNIKIKYSTNYYPQGNGLAESTNKNLIKILKRIVTKHQRNWHLSLPNALWADRVTIKTSLGNSPFFLVYGQEATLPTHTFLPSLQLALSVQDEECPVMQQRLNMLLKLEEERENSKQNLMQHQELVKIWFDRNSVGNKYFQEGDLVLKWDKENEMKGKHTKFQKLWLGPYQIYEKIGPGTFKLKSLEGDLEELHVNGQFLKRYFS
jgi:hypothetical protein